LVRAVDWATNDFLSRRPAVANMSILCALECPALDVALQGSLNAGLTWVTSGGNQGADACLYAPNRVPGLIRVGATDLYDGISSGGGTWAGSNWGECIDIMAPGDSVQMASHKDDSQSTDDSGTSFAAPYVAGGAALILQEQPNLSPAQVKALLIARATPGVVQGLEAKPGTPNLLLFVPPPVTVSIQGPMDLPGGGTYSWEAIPGEGGELYSYQWEILPWGHVNWQLLGTERVQSVTVDAWDADFQLRVTVRLAGAPGTAEVQVSGPCQNDPFVVCAARDSVTVQ
jgi:subtilisin family serine protease